MAEESHWRGGGHSLEGRLTEDSHWRGGGQSLEGRRTATGGAEDSDWNDRCPSGPPYACLAPVETAKCWWLLKIEPSLSLKPAQTPLKNGPKPLVKLHSSPKNSRAPA